MNIYGLGYGLRSRMPDVSQKTDQTLNKDVCDLVGGKMCRLRKACMWHLKVCSIN